MPVTTKERTTKPDINEELHRLNRAAGMTEPPRKNTALLKVLGVFQMLTGLFTIAFSFMAGTLFSVFLGAIIITAGVFQMIGAKASRSAPALLIGMLGASAGIFIILYPFISMATLSAILGIFLIGTGIFNMTAAGRQGTTTTGGLIEIGIGTIVLLGFFGMGLMAGAYLIIRGAINYRSGKTTTNSFR